jgi:hypothetical protein
MTKYANVLLGSLVVVSCIGCIFAEIIPNDRTMDWKPGVTVGVAGGIPYRTVIGATVDSATYGTGLIDASAAIGAAIDACAADCVVYIPSGTYRLDDRVYRAIANKVTATGARQPILPAPKTCWQSMPADGITTSISNG